MAIGWSIDVHSFPWTISKGGGTSVWWAPLAVVVIFGLAVATILTLILVPVMVSLANHIADRIRRYVRFDTQ
jgi:multidrug efflux pump subunit AcrB